MHGMKTLKLKKNVYCTLTEVFLNLTEVFLTLTEVFPCLFLSCKANAGVKLAKTGHGPHSFTLVAICVVRLLFVLFYVLFVCKCVLSPGDNPTAVNKYMYHIISYHKHTNDTIPNRTHDLPACSTVPQPTAPPHALLPSTCAYVNP